MNDKKIDIKTRIKVFLGHTIYDSNGVQLKPKHYYYLILSFVVPAIIFFFIDTFNLVDIEQLGGYYYLLILLLIIVSALYTPICGIDDLKKPGKVMAHTDYNRYLVSFIIDAAIFGVIWFYVILTYLNIFDIQMMQLFFFAMVIFYLLSDFVFIDKSIGKMIMRVHVIDRYSLDRARFTDRLLRRFIELFGWTIIFPTVYEMIEPKLRTAVVKINKTET